MVLRHGDLPRVAEFEATPGAQKARVLVGARPLLQTAFAQSLQPSGQLGQLTVGLLDGHLQPGRFGIVLVTSLLPATYVAPQLGPLVAQRLLTIYPVTA